jgi:hypothetical protein
MDAFIFKTTTESKKNHNKKGKNDKQSASGHESTTTTTSTSTKSNPVLVSTEDDNALIDKVQDDTISKKKKKKKKRKSSKNPMEAVSDRAPKASEATSSTAEEPLEEVHMQLTDRRKIKKKKLGTSLNKNEMVDSTETTVAADLSWVEDDPAHMTVAHNQINSLEDGATSRVLQLDKSKHKRSAKLVLPVAEEPPEEDVSVSNKHDQDGEEQVSKKKKNRRKESAQNGIIEPTESVAAVGSDEVSVLTETTDMANPCTGVGVSRHCEERLPPLGDKKQRRSSNGRKQRKSSRKSRIANETYQNSSSISLSGLLNDLVSARTEWQDSSQGSSLEPTYAQRLVKYLEKILDTFVQVSDALELVVKFGDNGQEGASDVERARNALASINSNYAPLFLCLWREKLQPTIALHWGNDTGDIADLLYRAAIVLKILTTHLKEQFFMRCAPAMDIELDVGTRKLVVTLLELFRREAWALSTAGASDLSPTFEPSAILQHAWGVEPHSEVWNDAHKKAGDAQGFRRACFKFLFAKPDRPHNAITSKALEELWLEYCEYQEMPEQLAKVHDSELGSKEESFQAAEIPNEAKAALKTMRGAPLPQKSW